MQNKGKDFLKEGSRGPSRSNPIETQLNPMILIWAFSLKTVHLQFFSTK